MENVDKLKVGVSLLSVMAGVIGAYWLPKEQVVLRACAFAFGAMVAVGLFIFSTPGREFLAYVRGAIQEVQKVVWPSKKQTWQMTGIVFMFVFVLAVFMWLVDKGLAWMIYDVFLGRGK